MKRKTVHIWGSGLTCQQEVKRPGQEANKESEKSTLLHNNCWRLNGQSRSSKHPEFVSSRGWWCSNLVMKRPAWCVIQFTIKVCRVNECSRPSFFFFQLPFPEMTDSNGTRKTQASVDLFTLDGYHHQMWTTGSRYQLVQAQVRKKAFGYNLSIVSEENMYARQMFHFARSSLKKKNLHASIIFPMVMILIKSNEHFSFWVNMYSNPVSQWSFKMNSPGS